MDSHHIGPRLIAPVYLQRLVDANDVVGWTVHSEGKQNVDAKVLMKWGRGWKDQPSVDQLVVQVSRQLRQVIDGPVDTLGVQRRRGHRAHLSSVLPVEPRVVTSCHYRAS